MSAVYLCKLYLNKIDFKNHSKILFPAHKNDQNSHDCQCQMLTRVQSSWNAHALPVHCWCKPKMGSLKNLLISYKIKYTPAL